MPPGTIDASRYRRWIAVAATTLVTVSVAGYGAIAAMATTTVAAVRSSALLAAGDSSNRAGLRALRQDQVDIALTARPLNQRLVNVAMVRATDGSGVEQVRPWISAVAQLGWRDTSALQNMLYVAAMRNDLAGIFDVTDAMLRRRQLTDQMIPILSTFEADPSSRDLFARRLVANPNWRGLYLSTTEHLLTPGQLAARYRLLRELQRRGSPITMSEAAQNIDAFERADLPVLGFGLWQMVHPGVTRPLGDTRFAAASEWSRLGQDNPVAYQWQISVGEGFRADAVVDAARATLDIDWNGRGVPVFAQQRTSGSTGSYQLDIGVSPANVADLAAFDFRLVCKDVKVSFRQIPQRPQRFVTERSVPCAYPMFQIAGNIQSATTPHQLSIQSLALRPLSRVREFD